MSTSSPKASKRPAESDLSLNAIFYRFRRNIAIVFGSRLLFGLMNLATNILVVRFFGVAELGIAVLLQGYARLCAGIIKPETWQMVLRFGATNQEILDKNESRDKLRHLFGLSFLIDVITFGASIIIAILFMPFAVEAFEWPDKVADFAPYFLISILFITHGTVTGVLRFYDRVDTLAWQFSLNATIRFSGIVLAILLDGGIYHIVIAWFAASVISGIWPMFAAFRELQKRQCTPIFWFSWEKGNAMFPGIWRFIGITHLTRQATQILTHGTALFIGSQFGAAAAGAYEIARGFSSAISKPSRMLGPLIFPEVAKLTAQKEWKSIRKLVLKLLRNTAIALIGLMIFLLLALPWLIELLYGKELIEQITLFRIHIIAAIISILSFMLQPLLLSANKSGTVLSITAICVVVYVLVSGFLVTHVGILAFAYGLIAYFTCYLLVTLGISMRLIKKRLIKQNSTVNVPAKTD